MPTQIEVPIGDPTQVATITLRGEEAVMHRPSAGGYCSHAKVVDLDAKVVDLDAKVLTNLHVDGGWGFQVETTRRAWEAAGFTFSRKRAAPARSPTPD